MRTVVQGTVSAAVLLFAAPVAAQTATAPVGSEPAPQAEAAKADELAVGDIVVTARKRSENLQDVPISVNVTSGDTLEKSNIATFKDLANTVPNLFVQQTVATPTLFIRGIGSNANNLAFEQSVGLFVDGVFRGRARQSQTAFLDVDRVEVLRGPQGALFGKNTSSGALNVTTRSPGKTPEYEAYLTGTVEGDNGVEGGLVASGPLSTTLGARLAFKASSNDGWFRNTTTGKREPRNSNQLGRLTLEFEPSAEFTARLKVDAWHANLRGAAFFSAPFGTPLQLTRATTPGLHEFDRGQGIDNGLTLQYMPQSGYVVTAITGFSAFDYRRRADTDFAPQSALVTTYGERFKQYSQEIRVASPKIGDVFEFTAGVYGQRAISDFETISDLTVAPFNGTFGRFLHQTGTALSAFAQGSIEPVEGLRLTVGLRQSHETKRGVQPRTRAGVLPASWLGSTLSGRTKENDFDPSAQIQYRFSPDVMLYGSYGKGSKAGGFVHAQSNGTDANFVFQGETSKSAEIGAKVELFDRRLRLNLAAFSTDYDNLQVSAFDPISNVTVTRNAATARTRGIELESQARLSRGLSFNASAAYLDAKYLDFPGASCLFGAPTPPGGGVCLQNIGGTRIPRAPRFTASGSFVLDTPVSGDLRAVGAATIAYRSSYDLDDTLNPFARQDRFAKIDLRAGIASARFEAAVLVRNLTNRLTSSYALGTPFTTGSEAFYVDQGRTIAIQLRIRR